MNRVVVYGSQHGTSEKYAREFASKINSPVYDYKSVGNLREYDEVIYFGGIYGGNIYGLGKFIKKLPKDFKNLRVVTVGLGEIEDPTNRQNILRSISRYMGDDFVKNTDFYHVRGAISSKGLSLVQRNLMKVYYESNMGLQPQDKTDITSIMGRAYGKDLDFVDMNMLAPVLADIVAEESVN